MMVQHPRGAPLTTLLARYAVDPTQERVVAAVQTGGV